MTTTVILEDNMTDGAVPMNGNISIDQNTGKVRIDFGDFDILVEREHLELVMYEDLHG